MKRLLIVNNNLQVGGAERQLYYIARNLVKEFYIEFLVLSKTGEFVSKIEDLGINIMEVKYSSLWNLSRIIREYAIKSHFDVLLSFLPLCNIACELSIFPIKRYKVYAGARSANPDFLTKKKYRLYYWAHSLADGVISNSLKNKSDILKINKLLPEKKVHVIRNILPINYVDTEGYSSRLDKIHIVVAANYRPVKNLLGLLEAIKSVKNEIEGKLLIDWYGLNVGTDFQNGISIIQEFGLNTIIRLNSATRDVFATYATADVVGLFSLFEGFPNSICEAILMGKMVIVTPVSDISTLLAGTGNIIAKSSTSNDIAQALVKLTKMGIDEIEYIGKNNKVAFENMFNEIQICNQIKAIIES